MSYITIPHKNIRFNISRTIHLFPSTKICSFCKLILKLISWINFRIFILTKGKTFSTTPSSLGEGKLRTSSAYNPPNATAPWRGNKLLFFLNFKSPQWNKRLPPAKISSIKAFKRLPPPRFSSYN